MMKKKRGDIKALDSLLTENEEEQFAQLAAFWHQQKVKQGEQKSKEKPSGLYKIQDTDNIWVTDQEGRPEILYGGDRNEILSMPLYDENGEYKEEAFKMLKKVAADKKRRIYFDLASEKLGKEIEKQIGFKIPLNKKENDDIVINKTRPVEQPHESSKTISNLSLVDTASNGEKQKPTIITEYSDGALEYTPILKEDNTLDTRAISDIEKYLSQEGIDFIEALNSSKINIQLPDKFVGMLYTAMDTYKELKQSDIDQKVFLLEDKQMKMESTIDATQTSNIAQNSNNQELFLIEDKQMRQKKIEDSSQSVTASQDDSNFNMETPEKILSINTSKEYITQNDEMGYFTIVNVVSEKDEKQYVLSESNEENKELLNSINQFLDDLNMDFDDAVATNFIKGKGIFKTASINEVRRAHKNYKEQLKIDKKEELGTNPEVLMDIFEIRDQNYEAIPFFKFHYQYATSIKLPLLDREKNLNMETYYIINEYLKENKVTTIEEARNKGLIYQDVFTSDELLEKVSESLYEFQSKSFNKLAYITLFNAWPSEEISIINTYEAAGGDFTFKEVLREKDFFYNEEALFRICYFLDQNNMNFDEAFENGLIKDTLISNYNKEEIILSVKEQVKLYHKYQKDLQKSKLVQSSPNIHSTSSQNETTENVTPSKNEQNIYSNISSVKMSGTFKSMDQPSAITFQCFYPDETFLEFTLFSDPEHSSSIVNIDALYEVLKNHEGETFLEAWSNGFIDIPIEAEFDNEFRAMFYVDHILEAYKKEMNFQPSNLDNNGLDNSTFASKVLSIELSYFDNNQEIIPACRFNYENYHSLAMPLRYDVAREFYYLLLENDLSLEAALENGFVYTKNEIEDNIFKDIIEKTESELEYCENYPIGTMNDIKIEPSMEGDNCLDLVIYYKGDRNIPNEKDWYRHQLSNENYYILEAFDHIDRFLVQKNMDFDIAMREGIITFADQIETKEIESIKEAVENYRNIEALAYTPEEKENLKRKPQEQEPMSKEVIKILSVQHEYGFSGAKLMPPSSKNNPYNIDENGILLYDDTAQYQKEAIACIDQILKDQDITFDEALEQGIIMVDNNPELDQIIEELKLEYSEEIKVLSMKIEQFTGENNPRLIVNYNDGSKGYFNMLTADGEDNQKTLEYIEQVLQENNLSYEDARSSKFIDFIPRKALSKVVTYEFNEPMHTENAPLQVPTLSDINAMKMRTVKQACVFYKDGSFKNILLEQREPQSNGKEIVYRFNDNLINEIEDSTGVALTLDDIKNLGKVEECTGQEFEDDFSKYLEESTKDITPDDKPPKNITSVDNPPKNKRFIDKIAEKTGVLVRKIGKGIQEIGTGAFKLIKNSMSGRIKIPSFKCVRESKLGVMKESFSRFFENGGIGNYLHKHKKECKNLVVYTIGGLAITAVIGITGKIIYDGLGLNVIKEKNKNISKQDGAEESKIDVTLFSDMTVEEALNALPNGQTKAMQTKHWNYINYYNGSLANQYKEDGKASKLAITYDNVKAEYFGYNADLLQQNDINKLYGNYKTSADELKNNLALGHEEDTMAYVVSKEEIDKSALFKTKDGQYFHHKYARIIAEMVSAETPNQKAKAVGKFRQFAIQEVDTMQQEFTENGRVPSYKLSLIPILDAAEFICERDQLDPILTEAQRNNFKDIITSQTDAYFDEITEKLAAVQLTETEDQTSIYGIFKEKVEKELAKQGIYDIGNRDIRDHSEFIIEREEEKAAENIEVVTNDHLTEYKDNYATETTYYTTEKYATAADTSEVTKIVFTTETDTTDNKEDYEVSDTVEEETEKINQEKTDTEARSIAEKTSEAINQNYQQDEEKNKEHLNQDIKTNNDNYQKNLEQIKNDQEINESTLGNGTEIFEDYQDIAGNLDNFVENLTTDDTGVNKTLPNLNIENQDKDEDLGQTKDNTVNLENTEYVEDGKYHIIESETAITVEKLAEEAVNKMASELIITGTREAKTK